MQPGANTSWTPGSPLTNGVTFRSYVQATQTNGMVSAWSYAQFSVVYDPPVLPELDAIAGTDPISGEPQVVLTVTGQDNLGTANQSSLESNVTTGFTALSNTTHAVVSSWAADGNYALELTATGSGNIGDQWLGGLLGIPVTPGSWYTAAITTLAKAIGGAGRTADLGIAWYDNTGAFISDPVVATGTTSNVTPLALLGSAQAPSNAAFAAPIFAVVGCSASEKHDTDKWGLMPGQNTPWGVGGLVGNTTCLVQYSDDGGGTWNPLRFGNGVPYGAGEVLTVIDEESIPQNSRLYRAISQTPIQGVQLQSLPSAVVSEATNLFPSWCLKNPLVQSSGVLFDLASDPTKTLRQQATMYDPLGAKFGIKMTDGWKGVDWQIRARVVGIANRRALESLLTSAPTVLLQSPLGEQWYMSVNGNVPQTFYAASGAKPFHDIDISLRQVLTP